MSPLSRSEAFTDCSGSEKMSAQTPTPSSLSVLLLGPRTDLMTTLSIWLMDQFPATVDLATAASLHEGMSRLCTHRATVILVDLSLPDGSGPDAVSALRRVTPSSALIAFSSTGDESGLLEAIRAGAHEVLPTPLSSPHSLSHAIQSALIRSGMRTAHTEPRSLAPPFATSTSLLKVVHDLNNALTSLNGFADILLARLPSEDSTRNCAEQIKKSVVRATALIQALQPRQTGLASSQTATPPTSASAA